MLSFAELIERQTFAERLEYLSLSGAVGVATFGFDRYLNQEFYRSTEWRNIRRDVIVRDQGYDLGIEGFTIGRIIVVHHMNPMTSEDLANNPRVLLDPEFLISVSTQTHNAIHFGSRVNTQVAFDERTPGDTKLW
jgi:hypothetical protein